MFQFRSLLDCGINYFIKDIFIVKVAKLHIFPTIKMNKIKSIGL